MGCQTVVLYHAQCRDGFAAAWVLWNRFHHDAEYIPVQYGQEPPLDKLEDKTVYIVDFSYKRDDMRQIGIIAEKVIVYDHHQTAQQELQSFITQEDKGVLGMSITFDMNRSGAGITWDKEFPNLPRPWLVSYVEDRDIWVNKLPGTREVNAYISSLAFDFVVWDNVGNRLRLHDAQAFGSLLVQKTTQYCTEVSKNTEFVNFAGRVHVPLVNAPQCDITELLMYQMETFKSPLVIGWWRRADGMYQYSLRSQGDLDVSVIAKSYGGGGHKNAAGFQLTQMLF